MMHAQPETAARSTDHASATLPANAERLAWKAHQLATEIASDNPDGVTQALRRAATAQWQRLYLDLPA